MIEEVWKPWPKFDGIAEVSNLGRARTLDREITQLSAKGTEYTRTQKGKELTLIDNGTGYFQVGFIISGKRTREYIHRLVGVLFVSNPLGLIEIDHDDEDKSNNVHTNLVWTTRQDNMKKCHLSNPHIVANLINQKL